MSRIIYFTLNSMKQLICRNLSILSFLLCYLLRWLFFFFPSQMSYIIYPDGAAIHFLISRTLSILSFLLCYLLHWLFFFLSISNVLYDLSWWCCHIFSYLQDLIHSIFSSLLSFSIDYKGKDRIDKVLEMRKSIAAQSGY